MKLQLPVTLSFSGNNQKANIGIFEIDEKVEQAIIDGELVFAPGYLIRPDGTKELKEISLIPDQTKENKRKPGIPVEFVGWICGDEKDREALQNLGVQGEMIWRKNKKIDSCVGRKSGIFECCTITFDIVDRLMSEYQAFWPGRFTGLREDGEQTIDQPLWKMGIDMMKAEEKELADRNFGQRLIDGLRGRR